MRAGGERLVKILEIQPAVHNLYFVPILQMCTAIQLAAPIAADGDFFLDKLNSLSFGDSPWQVRE